jgi:hypothetical protein
MYKPLTRTEMKIIIFNKMKHQGMTYAEATKQLESEIEGMRNSHSLAKSSTNGDTEEQDRISDTFYTDGNPFPNIKVNKKKKKKK